MSGLRLYDERYILIDEIYITIENWISPLKAETMIFLLALLISFSCNNVQIFSDSELVINRFFEMLAHGKNVTVRNMLKETNNILIWAMIRQLMNEEEFVLPTL